MPTSEFIVSPDNVCVGSNITLNYGGNAALNSSYQWEVTSSSPDQFSGQGPHLVSWSEAQQASISLVVTENGCESNTSIVPVSIHPLPIIAFNASPVYGCAPLAVQFSNTNHELAYSWDFDDPEAGSDNFVFESSPLHLFQRHGIYSVKLSAETEQGCISEVIGEVVVENCYIFVPNAFMPDSPNELNRIFKPVFDEIPAFYSMEVYNKLGIVVFATDNPEQGWDGMINGWKAPQGAYTYRIFYYDVVDKLRELKGTVLIIR